MGKFALLIGVSEYPEGLSALPAALNDVEAMREVLECPEMGEFDDVKQLLNPTRGQMQHEMEMLFRDRNSEDLLLLYFSGHGITDRDGNFFFSATKTRKDKGHLVKSSAVSARDVYDYMVDCQSDRKVVILDCCHSGAFGDRIPRHADDINFQDQLGGIGRIVLTASAAINYSFERADEKLAIYTQYLVEGIKTGAADRDEDGWVSVDDLHEFIVEKLLKADSRMTPQRYVEKDGGKIILTKAIVSDPMKQYRKFVRKYAKDGVIRRTGKRNLDFERDRLKLSIEDTEAIEADELCLYLEHLKHLKDYEACVEEELELTFPLDDRAREELQDLQKRLNLTAHEVAAIEDRVVKIRKYKQIAEAGAQTRLDVDASVKMAMRNNQQIDEARVQERLRVSDYHTRDEKIFHSKSIAQPKPKEPEKLITIETIEFLFIKGGQFMMGAPDNEESSCKAEKPQHLVTVPDFYMSKYLITQAQWKIIADLKPGLTPEPSYFKGDTWKLPVDNVSWHNVVDFCDRLSQHSNQQIQLPSEAQWEYACRAGTKTPFYFGETIDPSQANYEGNYTYGNGKEGDYRNKTTAVDTFKPNPFGLHDMHGNLWEWCLDSRHRNYDGAPTDGSSWDTSNNFGSESRVLRGGCWTRKPCCCRSAYRHNSTASSAYGNFGFRPILIPRTEELRIKNGELKSIFSTFTILNSQADRVNKILN